MKNLNFTENMFTPDRRQSRTIPPFQRNRKRLPKKKSVFDCQTGNRQNQVRRFRLPLYRFWQSKTAMLAIENEKLFTTLRSRLPPIRCDVCPLVSAHHRRQFCKAKQHREKELSIPRELMNLVLKKSLSAPATSP